MVTLVILVIFYDFFLLICLLNAANWAQISGKRETNVAITKEVAWSKRKGHALVAVQYPKIDNKTSSKKDRIYLIGGDDQDQGLTLNDPISGDYLGGGKFKNDVWSSYGADWEVMLNPLEKTKWGDSLAQIISRTTWNQTKSDYIHPANMTYSEWIDCNIRAQKNPNIKCDEAMVFSPRKNFGAVVLNEKIYVLGGRAMEMQQLPLYDLRGGIAGPLNAVKRNFALLKNDVWTSVDGLKWNVVNEGCSVLQEELLNPFGQYKHNCMSDTDCSGQSYCYFRDNNSKFGSCACKIWSPREFMSVTVHKNFIYLSGGYVWIQDPSCGPNTQKDYNGTAYYCGTGYRKYMNDVWRTPDGRNWERIQQTSKWLPRGEHTMISIDSYLVILGGRLNSEMVANDMWKSKDGEIWELVESSAPWKARAQHTATVVPGSQEAGSTLIVMYGENIYEIFDDVWTWNSSTGVWNEDYRPPSKFKNYVDSSSNMSLIDSIPSEHIGLMESSGIFTIQQLVDAPRDQILSLRDSIPICDYKAIATDIIHRCSLTDDAPDGEELSNVHIVEGKYGDILSKSTTDDDARLALSKWDGCIRLGHPTVDKTTSRISWPPIMGIKQVYSIREPFERSQRIPCRWNPKGRSSHASVFFRGAVFVAAGSIASGGLGNDVWYRDESKPTSQIIGHPTNETSETNFEFWCSQTGCLLEYHVVDAEERRVIRNWTLTGGKVDTTGWLQGGKYEIRIRAINAAGNTEDKFDIDRNFLIWIYTPPLPWGLIIGMICLFVVVALGLFLEWRRRRKKAAMERYAMKRMKRKENAAKKVANKASDWRKAYDEGKSGTTKKRHKKKDKDKDTKGDDKKEHKSKDKDDGKKKKHHKSKKTGENKKKEKDDK